MPTKKEKALVLKESIGNRVFMRKLNSVAFFISKFSLIALVLLQVFITAACEDKPRLLAKRIEHPDELIGGPRALGEVGDWLISNEKVRFIIQDQGFSRGSGVFGGSLIDADLVREGFEDADSAVAHGKDNFGEMFAAFFLEALEPAVVSDPNYTGKGKKKLAAIEVENDGSNGEDAVLVVRGYGNDFLAMTQVINENLLGDRRDQRALLLTTRYILKAHANYVEIKTTVQNITLDQTALEWDGGEALIGEEVPVPFGDVILFGAGNKVFMPGNSGYDIRYALEEVYAKGEHTLPALPGLVGDYVASSSKHVSYGLALKKSEKGQNFANFSGQFQNTTETSVHVPFLASAFTGVFEVIPPRLEPNDFKAGGADEFSFSRYFIVGDGSISSVSDTVYQLNNKVTVQVSGEVLSNISHQALQNVSVFFEDKNGHKITQARTDEFGHFRAHLPLGDYKVVIFKKDYRSLKSQKISLNAGDAPYLRLLLEEPAELQVYVSEPKIGAIPAKVSVVGIIDLKNSNQDSKEFLFDLEAGDYWRYTDLTPDDKNPETRQYLEKFAYLEKGEGTLKLRPGSYTIVISRGPEYDQYRQKVILKAGESKSIMAQLEHVVQSTNYAAGDFHLHSAASLDSSYSIKDSLIAYAAEGLDYVVSTDHNFVVDFNQNIAELDYHDILTSSVGIELTTIDRGHFNAFPLDYSYKGIEENPQTKGAYLNTRAARTMGAVEWAFRTPDEFFTDLRALGVPKENQQCSFDNSFDTPLEILLFKKELQNFGKTPDKCLQDKKDVIVQVNHPRDTILGYFNQYNMSQDTLDARISRSVFAPKLTEHPEFSPENFSWNFDAIEIYNGKRFELLHNFRVPQNITLDTRSCCPLVPGEVLRDFPKLDCDAERDNRNCTCTEADTMQQIADGNCTGADVAFPGVIEDWMQMLRAGIKVIGTSNSDSHDPQKNEPGYPRSYFYAENDKAPLLNEESMVEAFRSGKVLMSNGPFVEIDVNGTQMGGVHRVKNQKIKLNIKIQSSSWVVCNHLNIYVSGELVHQEDFEMLRSEENEKLLLLKKSIDLNISSDGFVILEITGEKSMFPTVVPNEVTHVQFSDVLGGIGESLGFAARDKSLRPELQYQVTPFALTNPIWLDVDGDGKIKPSLALPIQAQKRKSALFSKVKIPSFEENQSQTSVIEDVEDSRRREFKYEKYPKWFKSTGEMKDIRRIYWQFENHAH